jgi:hypothetical protein
VAGVFFEAEKEIQMERNLKLLKEKLYIEMDLNFAIGIFQKEINFCNRRGYCKWRWLCSKW